jgi:tetratricopeptide (TPR) repeat protein
MPALLVGIGGAILTACMTPPAYAAGAMSGSMYRFTQPWVALHYFKTFFLPTELSADTDWGYVSDPLATDAVTGYVFVVGLLVAAWRTARSRETRPVAFGILWFLLALLPTSLMPLAEVTNDHRMFFPFVGLSLAVFWGLRLMLFPMTARLTTNGRLLRGSVLALALVLAAAAAGTRSRNEVWHSDETLWRDVSLKSPKNGRGLMNYGLVFMERGDYGAALSYFERAMAFTPNYWSLEVNLGVANAGLHADAEAERHFLRALALAPGLADPPYYYARWLSTRGRGGESAAQLAIALQINRLHFDSRHLLMQLYATQKNWAALDPLAEETLRLAPDDEIARRIMANRGNPERAEMAAMGVISGEPTPETYLDLSLREYQAGRFGDSIQAAQKALELRPDYAEAYNNISAAYNSMGKWDEGIQAAAEAVRIKPDYQLAKNNMLWAIGEKKKAQASR